jgi:hypothetical protein
MMTMSRSRFLSPLLPALLALLFAGCAQTVVTKSATAPAASPIHFTKVFILALTNDDTNRRLAEVAVKTQITKIAAVGGYEFLPDVSDYKVKAKVIQAIKDSGADGLVVMRLNSTDTKVTMGASNARPMEYATFSGYYGTVYDVGAYYASDTRSVDADKVFNIETRIFDAKTDKLIWQGKTKSTKNMFDDHDIRGLMIEVSQVIKGELKSENLLR